MGMWGISIALIAFSLLVPIGAQNAFAATITISSTPLGNGFIVDTGQDGTPNAVITNAIVVTFSPGSFEDQGIVEFDISSLSSATIFSATLDLNVLSIINAPPPFPLDVFGYGPPDADGFVVLSDFDKGALVNTLSIPSPGMFSLDVTPFVTSAITNGDSFVGFNLNSKTTLGPPPVNSLVVFPSTSPLGPTLTIVFDQVIGGTIIPIDTTSLLLAGTYSTTAWLIPAIVAAIGIGIVILRKY